MGEEEKEDEEKEELVKRLPSINVEKKTKTFDIMKD